ncbi:shufflon system plasmid conjugative transfer pilus tip adhesin PilV [Scandinavium sp.]|uniref:type II secretion system protein n=1 Tax=Scandinavium sp. TaxID=2830653 RepID=UPI00289BB05D|nr:shufflon system plasmid conjugative transfer pilus tip adhesin PilV [Scandinavium sp.]
MGKSNKKGFSLLELILVLGVGSMITFVKFQDMKNEQDDFTAKTAGQQINQIGQAVNGYISLRYDKISTLTASSNQSSDPGPRTCNATGCEITYATLVNESLLPDTFNGMNIYKSPYKILLKRNGTAPNYVINGLITTSSAWSEGGKIRYDLLGKAMQTAGIDSGMTRTASSVAGFQGQWSEPSTAYNNITSEGLLAFRVGFNSSLYSVYLRRDGTLPMTGDLNMGGQSVYNAQNITAAGTTTTGVLKTNGAATVGTTLNVGGATTLTGPLAASNTLAVAGTSNLKGAATLGSALNVAGATTLTGAVNASNTLTVAGISSLKGAAALGSTLNVAGVTTLTGAVNANNALTVAGTSTLKGAASFASTLSVAGASTLTGAVTAKSTITASGNIISSGQVKGVTVASTGRMTAGEFLQISGTATAGASCSPAGLQGKNSAGALLSCVNGKWTAASGASVAMCYEACGGSYPKDLGSIRPGGGTGTSSGNFTALGYQCSGGFTNYGSNSSPVHFCSAN